MPACLKLLPSYSWPAMPCVRQETHCALPCYARESAPLCPALLHGHQPRWRPAFSNSAANEAAGVPPLDSESDALPVGTPGRESSRWSPGMTWSSTAAREYRPCPAETRQVSQRAAGFNQPVLRRRSATGVNRPLAEAVGACLPHLPLQLRSGFPRRIATGQPPAGNPPPHAMESTS